MKTKQFYFIAILISLFVFNSCKEDGDTTKPIINIISPAEGEILTIGEDMHLKMELSDNENLASYRIDIHNNFDGHGDHSGHSHEMALRALVQDLDTFSYNQAWYVSGKNAYIDHTEIHIPENSAPGQYHLIVFCTDESGNETNVARNIVLANE